jgi:hypothetical protein
MLFNWEAYFCKTLIYKNFRWRLKVEAQTRQEEQEGAKVECQKAEGRKSWGFGQKEQKEGEEINVYNHYLLYVVIF